MSKLPNSPLGHAVAIADKHAIVMDATTSLVRIYSIGGAHPATWNRFRTWGPVPSCRFDHFPGPEPRDHDDQAVFYAGTSLRMVVAERFQTRRYVPFSDHLRVAWFRPARNLDLIDLTGVWPTLAGASQAISSGPRSRARSWACAISRHWSHDFDGMVYRSSMDSGLPAVVLWERSRDAVHVADGDLALWDLSIRTEVLSCIAALGYKHGWKATASMD